MFRYALLTLVVAIGVVLFAQWVGGAVDRAFAASADRFEVRR